MSLVLVVQEKNIKSVAENYKKINTIIRISAAKKGTRNLFFIKISKISFRGALKELRSTVLETKPLPLPIFKNLFFLSLKISSPDID